MPVSKLENELKLEQLRAMENKISLLMLKYEGKTYRGIDTPEDLILINIVHKNNIFSTFSATTRANIDYKSSLDVLGARGRARVTGISLNTFEKHIKNKFVKLKKSSENFSKGLGPMRGMGNGHKKILNEFLTHKKKSSLGLEIEKNIYTIKAIHSIYNLILSKKNIYKTVQTRQGALGK